MLINESKKWVLLSSKSERNIEDFFYNNIQYIRVLFFHLAYCSIIMYEIKLSKFISQLLPEERWALDNTILSQDSFIKRFKLQKKLIENHSFRNYNNNTLQA